MKLTSPIEESKAELRQMEIEFRKKDELDKKHGRQGTISGLMADLIKKYLNE